MHRMSLRNFDLKFKRHTLVAMAIIGLILSVVFIITDFLANKEKDYAHLINISGRQRMLTQKSCLLTLKLQKTTEEKSRDNIKRSLSETIELYEASHYYLLDTIKEKETVNLMKNEISPHLSEHISILRKYLTSNLIEKDEINELIDNAHKYLEENLDKVVFTLEEDLNKLNNSIHLVQKIGFVLLIIVVLLEVFFIFLPLSKELKVQIIYIERKLKTLEKLNSEKSSFINNMVNELKAPLSAISQRLHHEDLLDLKSSMDKINQTFNRVSQLFEIDEGHIQFNQNNIDIHYLIKNIVTQHKTSKNEMIYSISPNVPKNILQDKNKVEFVLNELLTNANKFTEKGLINMAISSDDTSIIISVSDSGMGIRENEKDKIFERLYRTDKAIALNIPGQGLGLALAKEYAQSIGGTLFYASKPQGSLFIFKFPFLKTPGIKRKINRVLIVEDNEINQKVLATQIKNLNIDFDLAIDGQEAIDLCKTTAYDLILMDIQLPGINGLDATKILRKDLKIDCPIVAITTNVSVEMKNEFLEHGMNDVLEKPVSSVHLTLLIDKFRS
ncbi:response regulator receiver domain protein [Bacteriovorax sp. BSW11_IV]|uniref:response regulator n=1 Tax=Bacteriovorax sp. BSW11_IV TaxID=1353529 RepID=UPI00038A46E3|nr:response regulator [Bacteriovorax sp. BSW11_IV]EQC49016.1 response regulator receiver domain protein [Bacteriovorax sp. BSW11_IV]